jgi:hypothetical protein
LAQKLVTWLIAKSRSLVSDDLYRITQPQVPTTNCLIVLLNNSESLRIQFAAGHPASRGGALYWHPLHFATGFLLHFNRLHRPGRHLSEPRIIGIRFDASTNNRQYF